MVDRGDDRRRSATRRAFGAGTRAGAINIALDRGWLLGRVDPPARHPLLLVASYRRSGGGSTSATLAGRPRRHRRATSTAASRRGARLEGRLPRSRRSSARDLRTGSCMATEALTIVDVRDAARNAGRPRRRRGEHSARRAVSAGQAELRGAPLVATICESGLSVEPRGEPAARAGVKVINVSDGTAAFEPLAIDQAQHRRSMARDPGRRIPHTDRTFE